MTISTNIHLLRPVLPPFSLMRHFGNQNTRGNVSKISVSLSCYWQIGSKSTNHSPIAWRREGKKVTPVAVIGGFRSVLSIKPRPNDRNMPHNMSQHCWTQHVECVWPPCCDMLAVVGSSLKLVKFEPTTPNMSQQGGQTHATCCTQQCCVGMLRSFGRGLTRKTDGNFGNVAEGVLFSKVAYQRKRW